MSRDLSERQNTLLGVSAAFIEAIILQPTLYFKNAAARGLPFTLNPAVFYRGTGASIVNECQMMAVQFGITSALQKQFAQKKSFGSFEIDLPLWVSTEGRDFMSAALGGMLSAFFSSPVELVMIQQQVYGKSVMRTIRSITQTSGVFSRSGLMRGVLPTVCRDGIYVTGMLGVTPLLQTILMRDHACSAGTAGFYASIVGGVAASLVSHPFDLVKTVMQGDRLMAFTLPHPHPHADGKPHGPARTLPSIVSTLYKEGGVKRFTAGLFWRTVNITGTIYIANECRVRLAPVFATL
jgi:hypothetical protein